uniref:Uncharacterized protein n=1 Tax=Anopheles dirus TaxID=7168 RepID=A0A182NYT0_9DIPT
ISWRTVHLFDFAPGVCVVFEKCEVCCGVWRCRSLPTCSVIYECDEFEPSADRHGSVATKQTTLDVTSDEPHFGAIFTVFRCFARLQRTQSGASV